MWYQRATRAMGLWRFVLIGLIVLGAGLALFGDRLLRPLAPNCPAPPDFLAEVPEQVRDQLLALFDQGQLYCNTPPAGLKHLLGPVYWGSDGVNSLLFYQLSDPAGTVVTRYGFGQNFLPGPRGGPPPVGFRNEAGGRPIFANQAPAGSPYYYLLLGAPGDGDYAVDVTIQGPAVPNTTLTGRNVWRDMENLWRLVQGRPAAERERTSARAAMPVLAERWSTQRRRTVDPDFARVIGPEGGEQRTIPDPEKLRGATPGEPRVYQVLNGPLGAGVWVVGVMTGTLPTMSLVPREGGPAIDPIGAPQTYAGQGTAARLAAFAFPALPQGAVFDAHYWHNGARRAETEPDRMLPVVAP